ncbi:TonB-dependent receptor [Lampropedia puyangensis]|uniref:TonB-dependent receptor n=1 Tax=Lampropedia puyangensis TaxID=1330072 RepID=A0A4V4GRX1_9BURK|nr:TonB-dependent receptor [Lampropedia puyangensis]THU04006.1 TonB-dependent receptor [Lampropedia puyangensis]
MQFPPFKRHLLFALTVSTLASHAFSQGVPASQVDEQQLPEVTVMATRTAKTIAQMAGAVYTIDREKIAEQAGPGRSTADVLGQLVPSLAPATGTSSNYGMSMRGRTVQFMIDGVPLTGSRDGSRQLNSINPSMIERIEVISGATSLYGAGATGGIINIITRGANQKPLAFESEVGVGSGKRLNSDALRWQVAQRASFKREGLSGSLGLSMAQQGESQDSNGRRIGPEIAQTDRQDTRTLGINARLTWDLDADQQLTAGLHYYNDRQDSDYGPDYGPNLAVLFNPSYEPSREALPGLQLDAQPRTRHTGVNLQYRNQNFLDGQELTLESYYRGEVGRWFPSVSAVPHAALPNGFSYVAMQSNTDIDLWGLRSALHKDLDVAGRALALTYGVDYEQERDGQSGQSYNINAFIASNGLNYQPAQTYAMGPDVRVMNLGLFVQGDYPLTERLSVQAGVRHQRIRNRVADSTPYTEAIAASQVAGYQPKVLEGGSVSHSRTVFNAGLVYDLSDAQQLFFNFSQGFSLPDTQRMLRDVPANFVVNSTNVDPLQVNSYELGWRTQGMGGVDAGVTGFYNTSDKVVQFNRDYSVTMADTDERIWGLEGNLNYAMKNGWSTGGTLALTRGQYQDAAGNWKELNAFRVSPLKATAYVGWQSAEGIALKLQALAVGSTDRAWRDAQTASVSPSIRANPAARIDSYTIFDLVGQAPLGGGKLTFGVYNLANRNYHTVYGQQAAATYGKLSNLRAPGRTFAVGYSVAY